MKQKEIINELLKESINIKHDKNSHPHNIYYDNKTINLNINDIFITKYEVNNIKIYYNEHSITFLIYSNVEEYLETTKIKINPQKTKIFKIKGG